MYIEWHLTLFAVHSSSSTQAETHNLLNSNNNCNTTKEWTVGYVLSPPSSFPSAGICEERKMVKLHPKNINICHHQQLNSTDLWLQNNKDFNEMLTDSDDDDEGISSQGSTHKSKYVRQCLKHTARKI